MTRTLIAAMSGLGKSYVAQQDIETNLENVDYAIIADYKDEFRGLCKAGFAQWLGIGRPEAELSAEAWARVLRENRHLVCARSVTPETWQNWLATISYVAQKVINGTVLIVIDEAHFVAPQGKGYPDKVKELATTGRGNGVASTWITQRLQELAETVISQADARILGGFQNDNDLDKISPVIPYSVDVHNIQAKNPKGEWSEPLQVKEDPDGGILGSEWVYSDTSGEYRRFDSADLEMQSEHYGGESVKLDRPG
jgi:hypothetical protein